MALLIFHSSCIGYVLSLARMGLFHGTFKLRLNIEYINSGLRYVLDANGNSDTSGFFLGWDSKEKQDLFNGVMEGINVDEYITFDCERVTGRGTRALGSDSVQTTSQGKSYGKGVTLKRIDSNMPKTLRRR